MRVMPSSNEKINQEYFFTTTVSDELEKGDFIVEFFTKTPNPSSDDMPIKITKNFDDLIDFFEQLDE
jgi:hypothetical protein